MRAVVRQREVLMAEQANWVQRMQKALVQMNLQLTEVLSDVMGMTGRAIVRAIVAGERPQGAGTASPRADQGALTHQNCNSRGPVASRSLLPVGLSGGSGTR